MHKSQQAQAQAPNDFLFFVSLVAVAALLLWVGSLLNSGTL